MFMPSVDQIRSFLDIMQIDTIQLSQIESMQLIKMVAATESAYFHNCNNFFSEGEKNLWKQGSRTWFTIRSWIEQIKMTKPKSVEDIALLMQKYIDMSEDGPIHLSYGTWIFKGFYYSVDGPYSDEQFRLLIIEEFDKERRLFERLKQKHDSSRQESTQSRIRISEHVRIEVWRRDGGKCTRCDSRENLEYDHIIPLSRGGSNTTRNIELLCEKCNRSKGANIG